jgi:hypothetical protein
MAKVTPIKKAPAVYPWITTAQMGEQYPVSRSTFRRIRIDGLITEGIHWQYAPGISKNPRIIWNRELMRSWVSCNGDQNHPQHRRAIEVFLKSLVCTAA